MMVPSDRETGPGKDLLVISLSSGCAINLTLMEEGKSKKGKALSVLRERVVVREAYVEQSVIQ